MLIENQASTLTLNLAREPSTEIVVILEPSPTIDINSQQQAEVTFTPDNWHIPQDFVLISRQAGTTTLIISLGPLPQTGTISSQLNIITILKKLLIKIRILLEGALQ